MCLADLIECVCPPETWIDQARINEVDGRTTLREIGEMRSLQTLLAHPYVPQIEVDHVAGGGATDDDHSARCAQEYGRRHRLAAWMLEHDRRRAPFSKELPELTAESLYPRIPGIELRAGIGDRTPMVELRSIDAAGRPQGEAVLYPFLR